MSVVRTAEHNHLQNATSLSEHIKLVVGCCFGINLMGLNAILLAKQAGEGAGGFGVVSQAIRELSSELQQAMQLLRERSISLIEHSTGLLKNRRCYRLIQRAQQQVDDVRLNRLLDEIEQQAQQIGRQLQLLRRELLNQTDEAQRHCLLGSVLARAAKIEAAHAQAKQAVLRDLSGRFESQVQLMLDSVNRLQLSLKD
jgi:hypothetical protein